MFDVIERRNPLKTGLGTASENSKGGKRWMGSYCRNPLKTGLGTARLPALCAFRAPFRFRRNPLKTGLGTARAKTGWHWNNCGATESQSPENGSRHCKAIYRAIRALLGWLRSQSPENGSRHCKEVVRVSRWARKKLCRNPLKTGLGTARRLLDLAEMEGLI